MYQIKLVTEVCHYVFIWILGVFVPSQSLSQSPPPYEEALKHKVILSSYHSPGLPVVPTYSHPPSEVPRHYQTVSPNPSGSTPIILNPTTTTSLKAHSTTGRRPYPIVQNESYEHPVSNEWDQVHYSGKTLVLNISTNWLKVKIKVKPLIVKLRVQVKFIF